MRTGRLSLAALLASALLIVSCGHGAAGPAGEAGGCPREAVAAAGVKNPTMDRVFKHLDPRGQVLLYADLEGDVTRLAGWLDEILKLIKDEKLKVDLSRFNAVELVKLLGLDQITAVGLSSKQAGDQFHNKAFILAPAPRQGLLLMLDGKPVSFEIPTWAPADADGVMEMNVRLKTLAELLLKLTRKFIGEAQWQTAGAMLQQPVGGLQITYGQLLDTLDTRIYGLLRINEGHPMKLPKRKTSVPRVEALLAADGLAPVFELARNMAASSSSVKPSEDARWRKLTLSLPAGDELAAHYAPVLALDKKSGRLYLTSNEELLSRCLTGKDTLGETAEYRAAMRGLPTAGLGMTFRSVALVPKIKRFFDMIIEDGSEEDAEAKAGLDLISKALEVGFPTAAASVSTANQEGLHFTSNDSSSHKLTLFTLPYGNPMVIGVLAAVAVPAFLKYIRKSKQAAVKAHLDECAVAARRGRAARTGNPPASLGLVCPAGVASVDKLSDDTGAIDYGGQRKGYQALGWVISDKVAACFQYQRAALQRKAPPTFTCQAWTDLNEDGKPAHMTITGTWDARAKQWKMAPVVSEGDEF